MFDHLHDHRLSQLEISRAAADRAALDSALAERNAARVRTPLSHRLRHALAVQLVSTARLVDVR